jgi:hypothetical protein
MVGKRKGDAVIVGGCEEGLTLGDAQVSPMDIAQHGELLQRPAMPHFAQQRNSLQPAKTFFDALPLLLTDRIA